MSQQTVYATEFDETVSQYNKWLASLENPKVQRQNRIRAFLQGMGSVLDIFATSPGNIFRYDHPLYSRDDLNSAQKNVIALASDWQRVGITLDVVISGDSSNGDISIEDAIQGKKFVQHMYEHFRNIYVANAIR